MELRGGGDTYPKEEMLQDHNAKELKKYLAKKGAPAVLTMKLWGTRKWRE